MKINEVVRLRRPEYRKTDFEFDPKYSDREDENPDERDWYSGRPESEDEPEWGYYATGYPTSPHEFQLRQRQASEIATNAKAAWIYACRHISGENPWVPVVYDVTVKRLVDNPNEPVFHNKRSLHYRMERLVHGFQIPELVLFSSMLPVHKMLSEAIRNGRGRFRSRKFEEIYQADQEELEKWIEDFENPDNEDGGYKKAKTYLLDQLASMLEELSQMPSTWKELPPDLAEALEIIRRLSFRYNLDLHSENIMFRRTPTGVQLVITDPVSDN